MWMGPLERQLVGALSAILSAPSWPALGPVHYLFNHLLCSSAFLQSKLSTTNWGRYSIRTFLYLCVSLTAINFLLGAPLLSNLSHPKTEPMEIYVNVLYIIHHRWHHSLVFLCYGGWLLLCQQKDHSLHLCINYHNLNNFIIKNKYSLLFLNLAFEPLHTVTIFTKLDL